MLYSPLKSPVSQAVSKITSLFAKRGKNLRDLPQLLDPQWAQEIQNYLITSDGGLEKRKGMTLLFDASSADGILMLEQWTDDVYLYAYASVLAAYRISTDTKTVIKNDFATSGFDGARYGDYFFIASPDNKIGRVSFTLAYDGQTGNFTAGQVITGGTSGAKAVILEDADAGVTGTLTLGTVSGAFLNNEAITDPPGGAALVNGTLAYTYTEITNAPMASVLKVADTRLFAGNLRDNPAAVQYSEADTGGNPPFTVWNNATTAGAGGKIFYRNAGTVNDI
ncbi:MAG: hypothetical protein L0213_13310, partial [Candidatus Dadabacteria bacterium]|nr:hypothetical protein [Candidatus Dadabacteria bacterium]